MSPSSISRALRSPVGGGLAVALALSLFVVVDGARGLGGATLGALERQSLDARFRLRGPEPASDDVVILEIDEKTIALAPDLVARRRDIARVVDAAKAAGAAVIGLDLFFSAPEVLLSTDLVDALRDVVPLLPDDGPPDRVRALVDRVFEEVRGDEVLAEALARARPAVLALHAGAEGSARARDLSLKGARYARVIPGPALPPRAPSGKGSIAPLVDAASEQGLVTMNEDPDGRVRAIPGARRVDGVDDVLVPLSVILSAKLRGVPPQRIAFSGRDDAILLGDEVIPLTNGQLLLNFRGPRGAFERVSAVDLVEGRAPGDPLRGKIVLLALTFMSQDHVTTPFGARVPAVEIHATAVDNILSGDALRKTPPWVDGAVALLAALAIVALFSPRLGLTPVARVALGVTLAALFGFGTHAAFVTLDLWVGAVGPALAQLSTLTVCLVLAYLDEGLERYHLRRAFSRYLSKDLLDELMRDPERVRLSGDRRTLSVLFSDIRDFTTLSERMAPDALAALLTRYFTPMTRAVLAANGFLDKYIGDAIMAVFGAPVPHDDHARDACQAAITMHRELVRLQDELAREGLALDIGVGLNTGEMVVGNMGSQERFDYTVLGDSVNLASRIEGLTKEYGVFCLVGPQTRESAPPRFHFRTVDLVRVKGKERPVEVFELLGDGEHTIRRLHRLDAYTEGVLAFRAGHFPAARTAFVAFRAENDGDPLVELYLERLDTLGDTPPKGFDGIYTLDHK